MAECFFITHKRFPTLRLNAYIRDPNTTMLIVLAAMFFVPVLVRRIRSGRPHRQSLPEVVDIGRSGDAA